MQNHKPTEGEEIVQLFLEDEGIKHKQEVEITGLKGDTKSCRRADFYLPQYKVYVEFLGEWNNPEYKAEYIKKMKVYEQNNIPCVYIYPDNLGTLQYIFKMRLEEELKKYPGLKIQRLKYKIWKIRKFVGNLLTLWAFSIVFFTVIENLNTKTLTLGLTSTILITLATIGMIVYGSYLIFFKK